LNEFNRSWAQNASVLIIVLSKKTFLPPGAAAEVAAPTHSFDAGAAWAYLALQASLSGWHAHGMAGFDKERTRSLLGVPENYAIEAAVAVGKIGDKSICLKDCKPKRRQAHAKPLPIWPLKVNLKVDVKSTGISK